MNDRIQQGGIGVGSARRHRRVLRDTIQGITKDAIQRIAFKASVKSLSGLMYEELRSVMKVWLDDVIRVAHIYSRHYRKKTINEGMVSAALATTNGMYGWTDPELKVAVCKPRSRTAREATPALQSIRYYQMQYGCLSIPPAAFQKLAKEILHDYGVDTRLTKGALTLLQYGMESYCVKILQDANAIALHSNRQMVMPKDLQLARRIIHY